MCGCDGGSTACIFFCVCLEPKRDSYYDVCHCTFHLAYLKIIISKFKLMYNYIFKIQSKNSHRQGPFYDLYKSCM